MLKVVQLTLGSMKIICPLKELYLTQVEKHCYEVGNSEVPFADFPPCFLVLPLWPECLVGNVAGAHIIALSGRRQGLGSTV